MEVTNEKKCNRPVTSVISNVVNDVISVDRYDLAIYYNEFQQLNASTPSIDILPKITP